MACMDHDCRKCGHGWMDNVAYPPCPKCGSLNVSSHFDEEPDRDYTDHFAWSEHPEDDE